MAQEGARYWNAISSPIRAPWKRREDESGDLARKHGSSDELRRAAWNCIDRVIASIEEANGCTASTAEEKAEAYAQTTR